MRNKPFLTLILVFVSLFSFHPLYAPDYNIGRLSITEEDGVPDTYPYKLKFTNGSITDNGDGTTSISLGAGSQTPWTSAINGGGFNLTNTGSVAIGTASVMQTLTVGGDMTLSNANPNTVFRDSTDNTAYCFHLESGIGSAPYQNFQLWRGTDTGGLNSFAVNPDVPLMWFDNTNNVHFSGGIYSLSPTGLLLDQTVPQTVVNGAPIFDSGLTSNDNFILYGNFSFIGSGSFSWTDGGNYAEMQFGGGNLSLGNTSGPVYLQGWEVFLTPTVGSVKITDPASALNAVLDTSILTTADKTFTFPDASGTFALTGAGVSQDWLTTGTLGAGAITGTSFIIGANTLDTNEWDNLDGIITKTGTGALVLGTSPIIVTPEIAGNIKSESHQWHISIVNPNAVVTASAIIPICALTDAALTVTKIVVTTSSASYEALGDLKYADARIGLANATVVNDFDTTSGVRTDTTITSAAIASGKFVYLSFDSAPSASMTDMVIDIYFDYD